MITNSFLNQLNTFIKRLKNIGHKPSASAITPTIPPLKVEAELVDIPLQTQTEEHSDNVPLSDSLRGILISNQQHQNIHIDNTSINNLVRESHPAGLFAIILKELILNIIEPDRFLKNTKAILLLTLAWVLKDFSPEQIAQLLRQVIQ